MFGEKASDVKLHMEDGMITGIIHTPDETYHIEVLNFLDTVLPAVNFFYRIYDQSDIKPTNQTSFREEILNSSGFFMFLSS